MMTLLPSRHFSGWARLPTALRAIISGLLMALIPANVWPLLLLNLGVPLAAVVEMDCGRSLRDLRRDLRRDRFSRLYAAPARTAPWRAGRGPDLLPLLHGSASH